MIPRDRNFTHLAVDIDDTLLDSQLRLPTENVEAIRYLSRKGIRVILATGRMPAAVMRNVGPAIPFVDYLIAYNGALVIDLRSRHVAAEAPLSGKSIKEIMEVASDDQFGMIIFCGDQIYSLAPSNTTVVAMYSARVRLPIDEIQRYQINNRSVHKVLLYDRRLSKSNNDVELANAEQRVMNVLTGIDERLVNVFPTRIGFAQVTQKAASKLSGVSRVLALDGSELSSLVAIGDGYNDVDLIEAAGFGIAVRNAVTPAQAAARLIVESNDNGGVAQGISVAWPDVRNTDNFPPSASQW